jgi:hypothetical protein
MLIRDFACVLKNKKEILWHSIGDCELANDRVDLSRLATELQASRLSPALSNRDRLAQESCDLLPAFKLSGRLCFDPTLLASHDIRLGFAHAPHYP